MASDRHASPRDLLNQLVQKAVRQAVGSSHPVQFGESAEDVARLRRTLQSSLFNTLLGHLPGPLQHGSTRTPRSQLRPKERLLMISFNMRQKRKFDEAQQLEALLDHLTEMKGQSVQCADFIDSILEFLLALADTRQTPHKPALGHRRPVLPTVGLKAQGEHVALPEGPWFHGDGKHIHKCDQNRPYVNYARELFEGGGACHPGNDSGISEVSSNESQLDAKIFETEPGQDLRGNRLFAVKSIMGNAYERNTRESLFGGLIHSHVTSIHAKLSLPDLPDSTNPAFLGIKIPQLVESPLSDDEGYHESLSGSVTSVQSTPEKENLWEAALRYRPSRHRTWENIGNHPRRTERPYVTEAGAAVLDHIYELRCKEAAILQASGTPRPVILRDQHRLIQNVWNILIGLPSELFIWDKESSSFAINPEICLTGTTPESFHQLLTEFASAGTDYTRLWQTSQQPVADSTYMGGLVLQAFLGALRRYLQYYNAQVLLAQSQVESSDREVTVLVMRAMFSRLMAQLRYLARLCACDDRKGTKPGALGDPLPIGIQLLSYLYQEALDSTGTDNYRLMLSLLRSSCAPYLMFIQDWVFHGICRDAYGEFMIQANYTYLFYRDKHYWTHGYALKTGEGETTVPLFLQELSSDIYVCGKSINLLKQCAPEHFVCNVTVDTPCIGLTFSPTELVLVTSTTKTYIKHMEVLAGQLTVSRREKERREEEARVNLLSVARRTAAEEQRKHNDMVQKRREVLGAKKRKELLELKEQMQKDLLRRGQMLEDEKEEDKERMEEVTRREQAIEEAEGELEKQARDDVIKLYSELAKDATMREQRALWRIRRRQLDRERIEFLQRERDALVQELAAPAVPSANAGPQGTPIPIDTITKSERLVGALGGGSAQDETETLPRDGTDGGVRATMGTDESVSGPEAGSGELRGVSAPSKQNLQQRDTKPANPSETDVNARYIENNPIQAIDHVEFGGDVEDHDDDRLEVGDAGNEELEPVLALIRGSSKEGEVQKRPATSVKRMAKNARGISIAEFLPSAQKHQEDAELPIIDDEEQARDTTVDDVLLEIGSSLPSQDQAMGDKSSHHSVGEGNILEDILSAKSSPDSYGIGDGFIGLPHRSQGHGHPSQSSLQECASADDATVSQFGLPKRRHEHGHVSESSHKFSSDDVDLSGKAGDGGGIPVHGVPLRSHKHGHVSDSSLQTPDSVPDGQSKESDRLVGVPHLKHVHGHVSASSMDEASVDQGAVHGVPQRSHEHGHISDSSLQTFGSVPDGQNQESDRLVGVPHLKHVHGHVSASSLDKESDQTGQISGIPHRSNIHGHSSDSTMGGIMAGTDTKHELDTKSTAVVSDSGRTASAKASAPESHGIQGLPHRRALRRSDTLLQTLIEKQDESQPVGDRTALKGVPHLSHTHGHASDSSAGSLMYPSQGGEGGHPVVEKERRTVVAMNKYGHPTDSSVQKLMYPLEMRKDKDKDEEVIIEAVQLPVTVWADQGREVTEFNFNMFEGLPDTDLLGRTGYIPLKSEIGDYGVQASESESIEATDLLPLPIIIKRSITAPLRAQVWLVNQSILDYFLVDLRIDKHFVALRRFLFLQDGEFGQALCDQLFDKLAHCVHLQELLLPITLNQILSRAIQLSASSHSVMTDNLSFALKWHPNVFKPNAIDTLDCLELRYHVEWPNNIVIADTCLSKYNKVFSFLLQLKRTGWVLRDIHHQLKISAMLHQASGSPQYHQLQLFRHEMQHFVNVMQGYVVNQVIHVSWEEFQKDLKSNVHNLDDLREKHALYLNKAILRCLLNKKAAPVMKIICDILSLVLKVRTQLTSSPWAWDASSGQVIHPCFRNIKKSYMAFKEYSGFLYKVVAKLVTRGYQPHLEEFMLRLNFNNYYQEHKS